MHLLLLGVLSIPGLEQWNRFAPLPGAFLLLVGVLGVLSAVAAALHRRQLHWRL